MADATITVSILLAAFTANVILGLNLQEVTGRSVAVRYLKKKTCDKWSVKECCVLRGTCQPNFKSTACFLFL